MMENRPRAMGFTRGFSLERKHTVGKQITVEHDRKAQSYDNIQGNDHEYRHHARVK